MKAFTGKVLYITMDQPFSHFCLSPEVLFLAELVFVWSIDGLGFGYDTGVDVWQEEGEENGSHDAVDEGKAEERQRHAFIP